jgi:hypothetical protein
MWQPSIEAIGGTATYPMFDRLVAKMRRRTLTAPTSDGSGRGRFHLPGTFG